MDFGLAKDRTLFRQRVRALLAEEPVAGPVAALRADTDSEPDHRPLYRELGRRGLLAVNWPTGYGGTDRDLLDAAIVAEELVRAGVPDTLHVNTIQIVGLFLLLAGTDEQKARHLPAMARGERFASVLYTEPDAGSDLGSLRTTARADGDGWLLSGTKVFSLKSHLTDLGLCAARTGPPDGRYQGISLFLVDLHADGVERAVIASIADEQFHRVELRDVRVGPGDLIGAEGEGWSLLSEALAIERTGLDYSLKAETWLVAAETALTAGSDVDGAAALGDAVREELGRHGAAVAASRLLAWRVLTDIAAGSLDEAATAAAKWYASEVAQRIALWAPTRLAELPPMLDAAYREAPGLTISAGTSEMMLGIVANLALDAADPQPDPLRRRLRGAIRRRLAQVRPAPPAGRPLRLADSADATLAALAEVGAADLELPVEAGGMGLGLSAGTAVAEELGAAALDEGYLALARTADAAASDLADTDGGVVARDRIRRAAYLTGLARGALAVAVAHAGGRTQFGLALRDHQSVAFRLAAARVEVSALGLAVDHAAWLCDERQPADREAAEVLASAVEVAGATVRVAMQVCGVRGMTAERDAYRYHLRLRSVAVPAGALWRAAAGYRRAY